MSPTEAELNACFFRPLIWEPWDSGSLQGPLAWIPQSRLSAGAQDPTGLGSGPTSASQQVPDLGQFQILVERQLCMFEKGTRLFTRQAVLR